MGTDAAARALRSGAGALIVAGLACSPSAPVVEAPHAASATATPEVARPRDELALEFRPADFAGKDELLASLVRSRFRYFRYVNGPFSRAVCHLASSTFPAVEGMPTVNLHGDAHVEQYAVALDGRGLADFDAATLGPPSIDWLRFAASLWLVPGTDAEAGSAAVAAFARGYRVGLGDPDAHGPEPKVAERMRAKWETPTAWLDGVERLMIPFDASEIDHMAKARAEYVHDIVAQNPDLTEGFFVLKKAGALRVGIGSAHEEKMLMRVEGATSAPDDDVILEIKQLGATPSCDCTRGDAGDARRVIVGQSRIGSPQRFLGTCGADAKKYYVHAWRMHYRELDADDVRGAAELAELAYDVGLQLGKGHPKQLDRDGALRKELGALLDRSEGALGPTSRELADRVTAGWKQFREDVCRQRPLAECAGAR